MAKAIHHSLIKSLWHFKRGQFLEFSNGRVPQSNQTYFKFGKTEDTIARSNEVYEIIGRKFELRHMARGYVGENGVEWVRLENVLAWEIRGVGQGVDQGRG